MDNHGQWFINNGQNYSRQEYPRVQFANSSNEMYYEQNFGRVNSNFSRDFEGYRNCSNNEPAMNNPPTNSQHFNERDVGSSRVKRKRPSKRSKAHKQRKMEIPEPPNLHAMPFNLNFDRIMKKQAKFFTFYDLFDNFTSPKGYQVYSCKLCLMPRLTSDSLLAHAEGSKHQNKLKRLIESIAGTTDEEKRKNAKELMSSEFFNQAPLFQELAANTSEPLIGISYIIAILDGKAKRPFYSCALCNKTCGLSTIINHLKSLAHRHNYVSKHFPRVFSNLQIHIKSENDLNRILRDIAIEVDNPGERPNPFTYDDEYSNFTINKEQVYREVLNRAHVGEESIDLTGVLSLPINTRNCSMVLPPPPPKIRNQRIEPSKKTLEIYQNKIFYALNEIESRYIKYEDDPESHPYYNQEWKLFWSRKVDEIQENGQNPDDFDIATDFRSEWCEFFIQRMKEFHKMENVWKAEQIRKELRLTAEDVEGIENSVNFGASTSTSTIKREKIPENSIKVTNSVILKAMPLQKSLIQVLRILSTLETELGLLAPKVLDLISLALKNDRKQPKSSNELIFEDEHLNLLAMVKEKLVGLVTANLVENNKKKTVNESIKDVKNLITHSDVIVKVKNCFEKEEAPFSEIKEFVELYNK